MKLGKKMRERGLVCVEAKNERRRLEIICV